MWQVKDRHGNVLERLLDDQAEYKLQHGFRILGLGRCCGSLSVDKKQKVITVCGEVLVNVEGGLLCPLGDSKVEIVSRRNINRWRPLVPPYRPPRPASKTKQIESLEGQQSLPGMDGEAERNLPKKKRHLRN